MNRTTTNLSRIFCLAVAGVLALAAGLIASESSPAWADSTCSAAGQPPCDCGFLCLECDHDFLVLLGECSDASGFPEHCGGVDEPPCTLVEHIPSCKSDHFEYNSPQNNLGTVCNARDSDGFPSFCGGTNETACNLALQILVGKGPCKSGLANDRGTCRARDSDGYPTTCGGTGENPCLLDLQVLLGITSCKPGNFEYDGVCNLKDGDGFPSFCGDVNEEACNIILQVLVFKGPCKPGLANDRSTCRALDIDGFPTSCGGEGEKPCLLDVQAAFGITSCKPCSVEQFRIGIDANLCNGIGRDQYPSHCGRCNQDPCTIDVQAQTFLPACQPGLTNEGGTCKRLDSNGNSIACAGHGEPGVDSTVQAAATAPGQPIRGFADLHAHPLANLAFGGMVVWGEPFDPGGIDAALPDCDFACGIQAQTASGNPIRANSFPLPPGVPVHGVLGVNDLFGLARTGTLGHDVSGYPQFTDWPKHPGVTHQQMYYKWLERAFLGGQKLMVAHAVNNEILCAISPRQDGFSCEDMPTVDRQIDAVKDLEVHIDTLNGGPGKGWFRIATSAAGARSIMESGRMAVILGIEVDGLLGCEEGAGCTEEDVLRELDRYYAKGVRHVFPVHFFDNEFAGAAIGLDWLNLGNKIKTGHYFGVHDCSSDGIEFELAGVPSDPLSVLARSIAEPLLGVTFPNATYPPGGHCNSRGLTSLGESLVKLMMTRGMIIDVDHMSYRATDRTLEIATDARYPVVSGHSGFVDILEDEPFSRDDERSERRKLQRHVQAIRDLGGLVAPILNQATAAEGTQVGSVPNDCSRSSKSWAQAYLYAVNQMKGGPYHEAVALGSDFNGGIAQVAPRFGPDACEGDSHPTQGSPVTYPFSAHGVPGSFGRGRTGDRSFDYNVTGVTHVGLLPDFIQDLKNIGVTNEQLEPLFSSAEAYVSMWERIEARNPFAPKTDLAVAPPANAHGWHKGDVSMEMTASPVTGGWAIRSIRYAADGAGTIPSTTVPGTTARASVAAEGETTFRFRAEDAIGNLESEQTAAVKIDRTAPLATGSAAPPPNAEGWNNTPVTVTFNGTDGLSGLGACDAPVVLGTEGAGLQASGSCADRADNVSSAVTVEGIDIDLTPPSLTGSAAPPANAAGWNSTDVVVSFDAADTLSGVASVAPPVTLAGEGAGQSAAGLATDRAGNTASASLPGINIDKTPPVVSASAAPPPNAAGWNNTNVLVTFTATDSLSGVASVDAPVTLSAEGTGLGASGAASDLAGNTAGADVTGIKLDKTPPAVVWIGNAGTYSVDQTVGISCAATDALSGVASTTCQDLSGPAYGFPLGATTFSAEAVDFAGNTGSAAATFSVIVTAPSLAILTSRFVTDSAIAGSLNVKLDGYLRAIDRPSRLYILNGYKYELEAQIGRVVSDQDAQILLALVSALP